MPATLILPQHGRADLTRAAIASIRAHDPTPWPILVLDDGSPDDSADRIASLDDPALAVVRQPHRGVTAAWNHAARQAATPVAVFLNNDILAFGPFVERLIAPLLEPLSPGFAGERGRGEGVFASASPPSEGGAGGVALSHPGCSFGRPGRCSNLESNARTPCPLQHPGCSNPQPGCVMITGARLRRESSLPTHILNRLPARHFLEGWCFALRRDVLHHLGGFDELLRLYWSDTDLQCRLLTHAFDAGSPTTTDSSDPRSSPHKTSLLHAIPSLPLRHLGHRTTAPLPHRRAQWHADRAAFIAKWRVGRR